MTPGDVVQISPSASVNDALRGRLAFVEHVRGWGVIAGVQMEDGVAYVRVATADFDHVGTPRWLPGWLETDLSHD